MIGVGRMRCVWFVFMINVFTITMALANPIKEPNVAGAFYPADSGDLSTQINGFLDAVKSPHSSHQPMLVIAPHAGYVYSGPVAAHAFKALETGRFKTVVIIAPSHFYPFEGVAIWPRGGFKTPLGVVGVDQTFATSLMQQASFIKDLPEVFNQEHALEVELPFLQQTLGQGINIVPLLMGQPNIKVCEQLALALNQLIGQRDDVLVLISSDMSHYHPYAQANAIDAQTLAIIRRGDIQAFFNGNLDRSIEMCGFVPVTVAMMLAKLRGLDTAEVLTYANSGDTAGDKTKVVGYGSIVFYMSELSLKQQHDLLALARQTVTDFVKTGKSRFVTLQDDALNKIQGAFVTIHKNAKLRGCIGQIIGQQPLARTVQEMAVAAASQDPRFKPVELSELNDLTFEVSVLSEPHLINDINEIVLGKHGVIVVDDKGHQGVFLPQVATETGWSKEEFLNELCSQKAGLAADAWRNPNVHLYIFTAKVFSE